MKPSSMISLEKHWARYHTQYCLFSVQCCLTDVHMVRHVCLCECVLVLPLNCLEMIGAY